MSYRAENGSDVTGQCCVGACADKIPICLLFWVNQFLRGLRRRSIFPYTFSWLILYVMQLIFPEGWAASTIDSGLRRRSICSNFCFNDFICLCILSVLSSFSDPAWLDSVASGLHKKTIFVETIYWLLSHSPSIRFICRLSSSIIRRSF